MGDLTIDVSGGNEKVETNSLVIDTMDESNNTTPNKVDLNTLGRHKVIRMNQDKQPAKTAAPSTEAAAPKHTKKISLSGNTKTESNKTVVNASGGGRKKVSIDDLGLPPGDNKDEDVHESIEKDILDLDNPESPFMQYAKRKEEEAIEWIAEKEEERRLAEQFAEDEKEVNDLDDEEDENFNDAPEDFEDSELEVNMIDSSKNVIIDDDLDIGIDDEEEETEEMAVEDNITVEDQEEEIDALIDKDDLVEEEPEEEYDEDEEVEEEEYDNEEGSVVEPSDLKVSEEVKKEIPAEPEQYDAPDIDIEENEEIAETPDIEEEEDTSTSVGTTDNDEVIKHLQKLATEKIKPVSKRLDISSFTVLKKPVANINPIFQDSSSRVVKWVLPSQESTVLMKEFTGSELEKLREYSENSASLDNLNRRFKMIYDHISSPKPDSFEVWLKTTPYDDVDNYFFAIYIACFKGANFLPGDCPNKSCGETFITDDTNLMDMVKFTTKEAKEKFTELYRSEATPAGKGIYCTEIVPINEKIAISFRKPSIYNIFETSIIDERTSKKFASVIPYIPYIDTIYMIDTVNRNLIPVSYKVYPDNTTKTIRSKISKYDTALSVLNVDEFGIIKAYANAILSMNTGMKYVYPAVECPKCHSTTQETEVSAEELVFTRYQLGSLVTTSLS